MISVTEIRCLCLGESAGGIERVSLFGYLVDGRVVDIEEAISIAEESCDGPCEDGSPCRSCAAAFAAAVDAEREEEIDPSPARVAPCLPCKGKGCHWCHSGLRAWVRGRAVGSLPMTDPADQLGLAWALLDARPFTDIQIIGARDLLAIALPPGVSDTVRSRVLKEWRAAFGLRAA